jgi:hypothetical protein
MALSFVKYFASNTRQYEPILHHYWLKKKSPAFLRGPSQLKNKWLFGKNQCDEIRHPTNPA